MEPFAGALLHSCRSNSTRAKCLECDEFDDQRPYLSSVSKFPPTEWSFSPCVDAKRKLTIEPTQSAERRYAHVAPPAPGYWTAGRDSDRIDCVWRATMQIIPREGLRPVEVFSRSRSRKGFRCSNYSRSLFTRRAKPNRSEAGAGLPARPRIYESGHHYEIDDYCVETTRTATQAHFDLQCPAMCLPMVARSVSASGEM